MFLNTFLTFASSSIDNQSPYFKREQPKASTLSKTSNDEARSPTEVAPTESVEGTNKVVGHQRDPLRWFGMFVPPALKTSQNSFQSAVMDGLPCLASVMKELNDLEIDIRRTRKRLTKVNKDTKVEQDFARVRIQ